MAKGEGRDVLQYFLCVSDFVFSRRAHAQVLPVCRTLDRARPTLCGARQCHRWRQKAAEKVCGGEIRTSKADSKDSLRTSATSQSPSLDKPSFDVSVRVNLLSRLPQQRRCPGPDTIWLLPRGLLLFTLYTDG